MVFFYSIYSALMKYITNKLSYSRKQKIFVINNCLFFSFILFYISYYFFFNGLIYPAVKIVFHGSVIANQTIVYKNSILESIWLLYASGSYFNMGVLLIFSVIIPVLKFVMVSDNFYSFFKLYNLSLNFNENDKDDAKLIYYINIVNVNGEFALKKFSILSSISRFQFVDVFISLFIVSSLNLYLLEAKILIGAYHFLNYCVLSTISSYLLLTFMKIKINIFKDGNIRIFSSRGENILTGKNSGTIIYNENKEFNNIYDNNNNNTKDNHKWNKKNIKTKNSKENLGGLNSDNTNVAHKINNESENEDKIGHMNSKYKIDSNGNKSLEEDTSAGKTTGDEHMTSNKENGREEIDSIDGENVAENNSYENNIMCYNKLQSLNSVSYLYKVMKNNDAYIYLKKKKFNLLLRTNFQKTRFNTIKLAHAFILLFLLCLSIYFITLVETDMLGIYIYLNFFNFNIESVMIDYIDMLNILKLKVNKNYVFPFFFMFPFIFPLIIAISFFLSIFFMNLYYVNFSIWYKKITAFSDELVFDPEVPNNQKITISERHNYLCIKKEIEKNDKLSNTSDELSSHNNSTITSSKSEDINTEFVYNGLLNFYFLMSSFFASLCSILLHISLGEIISIAILIFYQIVKHTYNLNILVLYKTDKIHFSKFILFISFGLICFSINMYVTQWEKIIKKLQKIRKQIFLFESNRCSEIVDLNIQKNKNWNIPIYTYFFKFLIKQNQNILKKKKKIDISQNINNNHIIRTQSSTMYDNDENKNYQNMQSPNDEETLNYLDSSSITNIKNKKKNSNKKKKNSIDDTVGMINKCTNQSKGNNDCLINSGMRKEQCGPVSFLFSEVKKRSTKLGKTHHYVKKNRISGQNYEQIKDGEHDNIDDECKNEDEEIENVQIEEIHSSLEKSNSQNIPYIKNLMPIKSILLIQLEKLKAKKKKDRGVGNKFGEKSEPINIAKLFYYFHIILFILIITSIFMGFLKNEQVLKFNMNSVNKRLNDYFTSPNFYAFIPASIGKCKTQKYLAKEPCYEIGRIYHEEKTFYRATLLFLQGISSINIDNIYFYYDQGNYYLTFNGYFKHIIGPLFLKLCIGSNFCPISTYAYLVGNKPTFSITIEAQCDDYASPDYISNLVVSDLKITKIEVIKHSDIIENVDIQLDDIQERVQEKVNAILADHLEIIIWKNKKYNLESFINYLISRNSLFGFSCEPYNY
ncbi:conserved Plasmodium protein, unknown function [Plasmodium berghei]|uniref:Uncharacterized protein n=3 Tax=Plasmodium berghei TaxID=5821 RepID=A0A509AEZ1_PLABA|nr:conserved Plasmodium protein, unknown function [Plasmodium berghei ANKA]CXH95709.1 conserved Plasmodium protein, unknown function [Plasmodium berghei]SCL91052.1 conserved Plasmodium protein, unknown function [Plasmodium berghei]SCM17209.1 conserved Plasmodium protein, unknown function [Plasmodium berghei]VUC54154.1 conserved Plasmodium protein, unknown function [Plasmodium berghei ANKA]|eukprot:XP_034419999.1 conserved Plasmodium protein, unknown function [Plasmodium berghei ANKA]